MTTRFALPLLAACLATGLNAASAGELTFNISEYPPLNFEKDGKIVGMGADQVHEIMSRAGIAYKIEPMKWSRAIALAENTASNCVTTVHTEERNARFKWVEPLVQQDIVLVGLTGGAKADTLDAALAMRIGSWNADSSIDLLKKAGVSQIDLAPTMDNTLEKLKAGRIDFVPLSAAAIASVTAKGVSVTPVASIGASVTGIACALDTPDADITAMQEALNAMIADGKQEQILAVYR